MTPNFILVNHSLCCLKLLINTAAQMDEKMKFKLFVISVSTLGMFFISAAHADPIEKALDVISIPNAMKILEKMAIMIFEKLR